MSTRSPAQVSVSSTHSVPAQIGRLQRSQVYPVQAQSQEPQSEQSEQPGWDETTDRPSSGFQHNFSQVPVQTTSFPFIQPKLVIGQPNDRYEQEADRVANQVMQMPSAGMGRSIQPLSLNHSHSLQRQIESPEEEEKDEIVQAKEFSYPSIHLHNPQAQDTIQRQVKEDLKEDPKKDPKKDIEQEKTIQTKPASGHSSSVITNFQTQLRSSQHGGQPLAPPTRKSMESRFNHDFSGVRVHTDRNAAQLNQHIHAQAFTHGQHIYFGQGAYQPGSFTGEHLLAHELTHVVQQTGGSNIQPKALVQMRSSSSHLQARRNPQSIPISSTTETTLQNPDAGDPIPAQVQQQIATQVDADLSSVRVHTGERASLAATNLQARALTYGNHIFLNRDESKYDIGLMAHETVHVVQQHPALAYADTGLLSAPTQVQRIIPDYVLEELDDYARYIPGYTLFTVIVGYNPLRLTPVQRTPINLVQGLMELVPFGADIFNKLQELNVLQPAFDWVQQQLDRFDLNTARLERLLDEAYEEMDFVRFDPIDYNTAVLERKFGGLLSDVIAFATSLVEQIIQMIRDAAIGVAEGLLAGNQAWALLKKILHYDPLRGVTVEATTVEILEDFLLLINKQQELEQMRERGTLEQTAEWLDTQFAIFTSLLAELIGIFTAAWQAIQPENLSNFRTNLEALTNQVVGFLSRVWEFASTVAIEVLNLIKRSLLNWLSSFAHEIPGFHLLTVIAGRNPLTEEEVPLTPTNLIRGFMSLMPGGEQQFQELQETGVIPEAAQRIETTMDELGISWEFVQGLFLGVWEAFIIEDLLQPIDAFNRVLEQFREPLNRLFTFAIEVIKVILELVLVIMHFPTDLIGNIITNALQALDDIQRDPVGFLINLLETMKLGFSNFFNNILEHLIEGLANWLFSKVREAGIEPPTDLTFESILGFVLDILGLSINHLWELLANQVGQERVDQIRGSIDRLSGAWSFVQEVQERGIVAVWEYIESQLSNLWDLVLEQVQAWVMERVINVGMRWLLSFLDASGITPVINSFVAIFNAIESAIEYLNEMLAIINDFVSTVASIARGDIQPGAERMELGLSNSLPIVIGFLANQFGLDNIGERLQEIIAGARELVDAGLNWLIEQALRLGQSVLSALGLGTEPAQTSETEARTNLADTRVEETFSLSGEGHTLTAVVSEGRLTIFMASAHATRMSVMLINAIEEVSQDPTRPEEEREFILARLRQARELADENEIISSRIASGSRDPRSGAPVDSDNFLHIRLSMAMDALTPLSRLGIKNLDEFNAEIPLRRYLPTGYDVRARLYERGSSYGTALQGFWNRNSNTVYNRIVNAYNQAKHPTNPSRLQWNQLADEGIISSSEHRAFTYPVNLNRTNYPVDHEPALAEHWVDLDGNNESDGERNRAATNPSHLRVITQAANSEKLGNGRQFNHAFFVRPDFESIVAHAPKGSTTIDGEDFRNAP